MTKKEEISESVIQIQILVDSIESEIDYIRKKKATFLRTLVDDLIGEVDNLASLVRRIK